MNINEVIDTGSAPNLFHRSKLQKYNEPIDVEKLMPASSDADRYLELVTSESYKKTVERLQHYTNITPSQATLPQLVFLAINAMEKISNFQQGHEEYLEKLAVDVVLSLPEFDFFKHMIDRGELKIVALLDNIDLSNAITETEKIANNIQQTPEENEDDISDVEWTNMLFADEFKDISDEELQWKFAQMFKQGNAFNKTYLYNLVSSELDKINPELINLYGILSSVVQISYYAAPDMKFNIQQVADASVGSSEVKDEDPYTIYARSPYFPILIHEIVKGLWTYLTMSLVDNDTHDQRTIDDETIELMSGPGLYNKFAENIPYTDSKYLPFIFITLLKNNKLKNVINGGENAKYIIRDTLQQVKQTISDYENEL